MSDTPQGTPRRDPYEYHGSPEGNVQTANNYADAARGEIWHVHAKRGETVYVNQDDARRVEMHVENGGRVIPVGQEEFLDRGGRIGRDGYGRPYPPFVWESHRGVPRYDESGGAYRLPRGNRDQQVHIHVEIGNNGQGRIYRTGGDWENNGHIHSGGCGCGGNNRRRDGDLDGYGRPRYPRYPQDTDGFGRPRRHDDDLGTPPYFPQRRRGNQNGGVEVGVVLGDENVRIRGRVRIPIRNR